MKIRKFSEIFKQQANEEKYLRKTLKKLKENKKIQQAIELKKLEEARTNEIIKTVAKSITDPAKKVNVYKTGDITEFSVQDVILKHQGVLSTTDSIWAPWSKNFKG